MVHSEVEADDEFEEGINIKRLKPATKRNQLRITMEESIAKRNTLPQKEHISSSPKISITPPYFKRSRTIELDKKRLSSPPQNIQSSFSHEPKRIALKKRLIHDNHSVLDSKSVHSLSRSMECLNIGRSSPVNNTTPTSVRPHLHTPTADRRRATLPTLLHSSTGEHPLTSGTNKLLQGKHIQ